MKRAIYLIAALAAFATMLAAPAMAVQFWSEPFANPDGALTVVNTNWVTHSGSGGADVQVISGVANGDMANTPDDNRGFPARTLTDKTYACFDVSIPPITSGAPIAAYFAHFKDSGTFNFASRVYVLPMGTTFTFGLSVSSCASPCTPVPWTAALNYNQTYRVTISYDAAGLLSELWVDAASEASPKIVSNTSSGSPGPFAVSAFALRQASANWKYKVDNIQVGTTFDDACQIATPTRPGTWGRVKTLYR